MSNVIKFECQKEIKDKEETGIIVKGIKSLFDTIAMEAEGTCICGRDLNVLTDYDIDTTCFNRNKKSITKLVYIQVYIGGNGFFLKCGEIYINCGWILVSTQLCTLFTPELSHRGEVCPVLGSVL